MEEDSSKPSGRTKPGKDKDGDEEMTVVVPPPKASKLSGAPQKDPEGDIAMNGAAEVEAKESVEQVEDPKNKAVAGMSDDKSLPNPSHAFRQVKAN